MLGKHPREVWPVHSVDFCEVGTGEAERGSLRVGARADLALLDAELGVRETWIAGRRVYRA